MTPGARVAPDLGSSTGPAATIRPAPYSVGREPEAARLQTFLAQTRRKEGGLVLISGEAGVGKTRMLRDAAEAARREGFLVLTVACQDHDRGVPYAPWVDLVREFVRQNPRDLVFRTAGPHLGALQKLAPELLENVWLHDPAVTPPKEWERRPFLAAVARFLIDLSTVQPLLISVDDLGWADAGSLELLETVVRVSHGSPLGVLGAYRDAHFDENDGLQGLVAHLDREPWVTKLTLPPLGADGAGTLVGVLLERSSVDREFLDLLYAKTRGNPFYTGEILQSLANEGIVYRTSTGWEWGPIGAIQLPATIGGTIGGRLARLDPPHRQVLRVASILGLDFTFELLRQVSESPPDQIMGALEAARDARLVSERVSSRADVTFEFAHPLIQEVLEKEVSVTRSRALHLRAAHALETAYGTAARDHAATLAYHYLRANDTPRALAYSLEAGDRAAAVFAKAEAMGHYQTALELANEKDDPRLYTSIKDRLADQVRAVSDVSRAYRLYLEAAEGWERLGERGPAGDCLRRAADCWLGALDQGDALLERSRQLLEGVPPGRPHIFWHLSYGAAIFDQGRVSETDAEYRRALGLAKTLGETDLEAQALLRLPYCVPIDRRTDCVGLDNQAEKIVAQHHLVEQAELLILSRAVYALHCEGNLPQAFGLVQEGIAAAQKSGDVELESWWKGFAIPWATVRSGDFGMGLALVEERRKLNRPLSRTGWAPDVEAVGVRAWLTILLGDLVRGEELLAEAIRAERARPVGRAEAFNHQFLGRLRLANSDPQGAVDSLEASRATYLRAGPPAWHVVLYADTLRWLVRAAFEAGKPALGRERTAELEELAKVFQSDPVWALAWRGRAACALQEGDGARSLELLERARSVWERIGWKYDLAATWAEIGDALRLAGETQRAGDAFREAAERFRSMRATPDLLRVERRMSAG
jgi:tetratricopeptide (TPR) repeat protein